MHLTAYSTRLFSSPNLLSYSFCSTLCSINKNMPHVHLFNQMLNLSLLLFQLPKWIKSRTHHIPSTTTTNLHRPPLSRFRQSQQSLRSPPITTSDENHHSSTSFLANPLKKKKKIDCDLWECFIYLEIWSLKGYFDWWMERGEGKGGSVVVLGGFIMVLRGTKGEERRVSSKVVGLVVVVGRDHKGCRQRRW